MPWEALDTPGELGRLRDIAVVLIRHGFGDVVQRIGIAAALERAGRSSAGEFQGNRRGSVRPLEYAAPWRTWADLRQARPGSGNPRRSPSCGMVRRARKVAGCRTRRPAGGDLGAA